MSFQGFHEDKEGTWYKYDPKIGPYSDLIY